MMETFSASCHCQAVKIEFDAELPLVVDDCNCSICFKTGNLYVILPKSQFRLLTDQQHLSVYRFNTGVAQHTFCKHCGVKPFYTPRSNPDGISVNARCIDGELPEMNIVPFDGQNWEQHAHTLAHKSKD